MLEAKEKKARRKLPKQPSRPNLEKEQSPEIIDALTGEELDTSFSILDILKAEKEEDADSGGLRKSVIEGNVPGVTIANDTRNGKETKLPKYDFLKVNHKFIESYEPGQSFVLSRNGGYDRLVYECKERFDRLIENGYEIHGQVFIPPDYILFIFRLHNDKTGKK